jgi:hypothetical protein
MREDKRELTRQAHAELAMEERRKVIAERGRSIGPDDIFPMDKPIEQEYVNGNRKPPQGGSRTALPASRPEPKRVVHDEDREDAEIAAMFEAVGALVKLDGTARSRVVRYLAERFGG